LQWVNFPSFAHCSSEISSADMGNLDEYQIIFSLSMASDIMSQCTGTQSRLQGCIEKHLPPVIAGIGPEWSLTWGPVVWQSTGSTYPDNAWYVANNKSMQFADGTFNTYVVAIAGSCGPRTDYDWVNEDEAVGTVVDFLAWTHNITQPPQQTTPVPDGTYIAWGTANATFNLINTPAPSTAQGAGLTLYKYLSSLQPEPNSRIIFTGHSLGGALSPTLALSFSQAGGFQGFQLVTYPLAGPTPGNAAFANLFTEKFPQFPSGSNLKHQVWNCNIVNHSDIVPMAWCTNDTCGLNLNNLYTIFGELSCFCHEQIKYLLLNPLLNHLHPDNLAYFPIPYSTFQSSTQPAKPPSTLLSYLSDAHAQHYKEYYNQFCLSPPGDGCPCSGLGERTGDDGKAIYPIIHVLALAKRKLEEEVKRIDA
jgi:hypothetical protein